MRYILRLLIVFLLLFFVSNSNADKPYRVGTTAVNFLEIGFGGMVQGMGDAGVSSVNDISSIYWNPARMSYIEGNQVNFMSMPWIADIQISNANVGVNLGRYGVLGFGYFECDYGEMKVTTLEYQNGTGEHFTAKDYSIVVGYSRRITDWFAFGFNGKYIGSKIWHTSGGAFALDLGVSVQTFFFSPTGLRQDGLNISMSISNYGTRLRYMGMDLKQPIDLYPNENGNYADTEGEFSTQYWELPLMFRIGFSITPIVLKNHKVLLEVDALHPNNNSESVNIGLEYKYTVPHFGEFYIRTGYKGVFLVDSEYGLSYGLGLLYRLMGNRGIKIDYAYRDVGVFKGMHSYTVGFIF